MTTNRRDIQRSFATTLNAKADKTRFQSATLGHPDGTVYITDRPGYVWARLGGQNGQIIQLYARGLMAAYNMPVVIQRLAHRPQDFGIVDLDLDAWPSQESGDTQGGWDGSAYIGKHGAQHWYYGGDAILVHLRAFTPLRVYAAGGMSIGVQPGIIPRAGVDLNIVGQVIDLTDEIPGTANQQRYSLITLNTTGALTVTSGTAVSGFQALGLANVPDTPTGHFRLAAIRLYYGQTTIGESATGTDIVDLRWPQESIAGSVYDLFGTQTANTVFAGPATGADALPAFRSLVVADLPAHNLLSATHGDTLADTVVRGDFLVGNATPAWSRLPIGAANKVLQSDGTDAVWSTNTLTISGNSTINGSLVGNISGGGTLNFNDPADNLYTGGQVVVGPAPLLGDDLALQDATNSTLFRLKLGKTFTVNNTLTLSGTDSSALTLTTSLTNQGAAGVLNWGGAYTLTVPASGVSALLDYANNPTTGFGIEIAPRYTLDVAGNMAITSNDASVDELMYFGTLHSTTAANSRAWAWRANKSQAGDSNYSLDLVWGLGGAGGGYLPLFRIYNGTTPLFQLATATGLTLIGNSAGLTNITSVTTKSLYVSDPTRYVQFEVADTTANINYPLYVAHRKTDGLAVGTGSGIKLVGVDGVSGAQAPTDLGGIVAVRETSGNLGSLRLMDGNAGTLREVARLYANRMAVGIASTTISAKLHVAGTEDLPVLWAVGFTTQTSAVASIARADTSGTGVRPVLSLDFSGSGADNNGGSIPLLGRNSTTAGAAIARLAWSLPTAAVGSYKGRVNLYVSDAGGEKQIAQLDTDGTNADAKIGGATTYLDVVDNGDAFFVGAGSGIPYASVSISDNATATTIGSASTYVQVAFDTDGVSNLATPDHTNDHITIVKTGVYRIEAHGDCHDGTVNNNYEIAVCKNNGATVLNGGLRTHIFFDFATSEPQFAIEDHVALTAGDTVELWVKNNTAGNNITFEFVSLMLEMVGG